MDKATKNQMMCAGADWREAGQQAVLQALRQGPAIGVRELLERIPSSACVGRHQALAALRAGIAGGLVVLQIQGATVRLSLPNSLARRRRTVSTTAATRRGSTPATQQATQRHSAVTAAVGAALVAAGCASTPSPQVQSGTPPPVVAPRPSMGVQQVLDSQATPYFIACSECALPTPKTLRVAMPADAMPAALPVRAPAAIQPQPQPRSDPTASRATALLFAPGSSKLTRAAQKDLEAFASAARDAPAIYVRGATDATGDVTRNEILARNRAAVVRAALMARGVPRGTIHTDACSACYVESNEHDAGRQANRRVELSLAPLEARIHHALKNSRAPAPATIAARP